MILARLAQDESIVHFETKRVTERDLESMSPRQRAPDERPSHQADDVELKNSY
jgi:hypothetical protein